MRDAWYPRGNRDERRTHTILDSAAPAPQDQAPRSRELRLMALPFLDREHSIAGPGFSRWLVPPAALAIHLWFDQRNRFSVFNPPLSRAIGISSSAPGDWTLSTIGWVFSVAIVFLGLSAALFGAWLE